MYELYLESAAERGLKRLETVLFRRIIKVLQKLQGEPRPAGCRKLAGALNDWRIRLGDYRIVYEILDPTRTIRIMRSRHRSEAYRHLAGD